MERLTVTVYSAAMSRSMMIAIAFAATMAMLLATPLVAIADTGLPLPRFASLRANKVHLRTGPGVRYLSLIHISEPTRPERIGVCGLGVEKK